MTDEICQCGGAIMYCIPMMHNKFVTDEAYKVCTSCLIEYPAVIEPNASVPVFASDGLLASMAIRYRHDFGILPADEQRTIMAIMRQIHEEVVGKGFYKPEHEEKFKRALNYE